MNSFVRKLYLYRFLNGFMFIFPLYSVMFQDNGLDAFQISILIVIWAVTVFLLQVPSGALADKFSRKYILIFAQSMKMAGYLTWLLFPSFGGFLTGFVLWGIQGAFMSGTFEALLYDELQKYDKREEYTKVYGRMRTADFSGLIFASALATPLYSLGGYPYILIGSSILLIGSMATLITLPNIKNRESTHEAEYFHLLKEGAKIVLHTPILLRLIVFLALTMALSGPISDYYGIFIRDAGVATAHIGIFMAIAGGADVAGSLTAHKYKHHKNSVFYALFIATGTLLLVATSLFNVFGLALLLIYGFLSRIIKTVFEGKLQDEIPHGIRATVSSVYGFTMEFFIIILTLSFGYVAQGRQIQSGFMLIALIMIALGSIYLIQRFVRVNILHIKDHHLTQKVLARSGFRKDNIEIDVDVGPPQDIQMP